MVLERGSFQTAGLEGDFQAPWVAYKNWSNWVLEGFTATAFVQDGKSKEHRDASRA